MVQQEVKVVKKELKAAQQVVKKKAMMFKYLIKLVVREEFEEVVVNFVVASSLKLELEVVPN